MPRRVAGYTSRDGFGTQNLLASTGAGLLGLAMLCFGVNIVVSVVKRRTRRAGDNPWEAFTLEWATTSPPPPLNFDAEHPLPPVRSYTPLLDLQQERT